MEQTALSQYARLESLGVWTPDPGARRVNVVVSFGTATLVIADQKDHPLTHWSLAAVVRVNPGQRPAIFSPSAEATELLEIADDDMVKALEQVRKAVLRRQPRGGRLRRGLVAAAVATGLLATIVWGPDVLRAHTIRSLPDAARVEIGLAARDALQRVAGQPCSRADGLRALETLTQTLPLTNTRAVLILPGGPDQAIALPGGWTVLDRRMVEDHDGPEITAGHILTADVRAVEAPPLDALLGSAGVLATARLLTTGHLDTAVVSTYAETLMRRPAPPVQDAALLERFAQAGLSARAFAFSLDITGETTLGLIEADPVRPENSRSLMPDRDWLALQGICE